MLFQFDQLMTIGRFFFTSLFIWLTCLIFFLHPFDFSFCSPFHRTFPFPFYCGIVRAIDGGGSSSFCSLTSIDRFIPSFFSLSLQLQPVWVPRQKLRFRIGKSTVTAAKFAPKLDRVVEDFSAGRKKASRRRSKIGQIKLTKKKKNATASAAASNQLDRWRTTN